MGMAASQARYLALVARKSNCEYEGQQINQARTVLSNQSASLFNQMLGLSVPVPPSTQDFTKLQYSFESGPSKFVIDNWEQLATPEGEYNYVVTYHYNKDVYTGSQKQMNDPQVQFSQGIEVSPAELTQAMNAITAAEVALAEAEKAEVEANIAKKSLNNYTDRTSFNRVKSCSYNSKDDIYTVSSAKTTTIDDVEYELYKSTSTEDQKEYFKKDDGQYYYLEDGQPTLAEGKDDKDFKPVFNTNDFKGYSKLKPEQQTLVSNTIQSLIDAGALPKTAINNLSDMYYDEISGAITYRNKLNSLPTNTTNGNTILEIFNTQGDNDITKLLAQYQNQIDIAHKETIAKQGEKDRAVAQYESYMSPTYIGNCELTLLGTLTSDQEAEIKQIIKDMEANKIDSSIANCYKDGKYQGGIYQFKMNGITYFTTYDDLNSAYKSGTGINHIDGQHAISYYNATYVSTPINKTEKALLETDSSGRFVSVRFADNTLTYPLNSETITDDIAYKDAMNQYNYENAKYDKIVQDINAKTSIIQQEDQQLELRLKQLDTEQNALTTEIDAVSKIVKDNIEKSFKTFGG